MLSRRKNPFILAKQVKKLWFWFWVVGLGLGYLMLLSNPPLEKHYQTITYNQQPLLNNALLMEDFSGSEANLTKNQQPVTHNH